MNTNVNKRTSERQNRNHRRMVRMIRRRLLVFLVVLGISLVAVTAFSGAEKTSAKTDRTKMLTSVYVQEGDSLWSIAEEYYTPEFGSIREYVKEIRNTNGLSGDKILYGYTLLIPYYN